ASESPQRRAILRRLGVRFSERPARVRELRRGDQHAIALENALRKAQAADTGDERELVLACDTLVSLDGVIYGKPSGEAAARCTGRMPSAGAGARAGGLRNAKAPARAGAFRSLDCARPGFPGSRRRSGAAMRRRENVSQRAPPLLTWACSAI